MDLIVSKSNGLRGGIKIPANKSHSFRALIMAGLAEGTSKVHEPAVSSDWMRGTEALELFGAEVDPKANNVWEIRGTAGALKTPDDIVDCGNSGIILRFFAALAGCCDGYTVLSGDHSLRHIRLCQPLIDAMNQLGAWAVSTKGDGHAPIVVRGRLRGGQAEVDGIDSQPVSALLIACAMADAPTDLIVRRAGEKPWVGLTLGWLRRCGVEISNDNFDRFRIRGKGRWKAFDTRIALDWSAALYPIAAAVLTEGSEVVLPGMDFADTQPDRLVVDVLRQMGADIEVRPDGIVARSSRLTGRQIDCNDFIDQFMLLAVVGACADGETVLTNAEVCRYKECDRISAMHNALKLMGADVQERPDGLVIRKSQLHGAVIDSMADHRMVMTLAVAGMTSPTPTLIRGTECVKKTFPDFIHQMEGLGADFEGQ